MMFRMKKFLAAFLAFLGLTFPRCVRVVWGRAKDRAEGAWIMPLSILGMLVMTVFEPFIVLYISSLGCLFFLFTGWVKAIDRDEA